MSRVIDPAHLFVYQIDNPTLHQVIYTLFFSHPWHHALPF